MDKILIRVRIGDYLFPDVEQSLKDFISELQEVYNNNIKKFEYLEFVNKEVIGYSPKYVLFGDRKENNKEFKERCKKNKQKKEKEEIEKKEIEKKEYELYLKLKEKFEN